VGLTFTVSKSVTYFPMSWEMIEDFPYTLLWLTAEEWAVEIDLLRGIRRALQHQPIASLKRAATLAIRRAEQVTNFPVMHWVDDPWKHRATWYPVP
jgi:hypothetical protein